MTGELTWGRYLGGFAFPLTGGILGGAPLVVALAHAQFMMEHRR